MNECWSSSIDQRPSFNVIVSRLGTMRGCVNDVEGDKEEDMMTSTQRQSMCDKDKLNNQSFHLHQHQVKPIEIGRL